jgi:hypothetical protein
LPELQFETAEAMVALARVNATHTVDPRDAEKHLD